MALVPSMWTAMYLEDTPAEALRRIADQGWPAVEVSSEHAEVMRSDPATRDELRQTAQSCGVALEQLHAWLPADVASLDEAKRIQSMQAVADDLRLCAELGIPVAVIHAGGYGPAPESCSLTPSQQKTAIERLRVESFAQLAALCSQLGVKLALENTVDVGQSGPWGMRKFGALFEELLQLCDQVDPQVLGICLDTSHANWQGLDIPEAIRLLGDRLWALHMSDNHGTGDDHLIPGYGNIQWAPIVAALREIGCERPFNLEVGGARKGDRSLLDLRSRHALDICCQLLDYTV